MNLIELSEQLKDVPDQLLLKEVQAPSGAYPSYLVVTEMGRRKRMREQSMKEAPTTTVAQDLAQPSREQMMMAAAQAQAAQQQAQPQPQPQAQPQAQPMSQRVNAGIMAAPQAQESLAAQDVGPESMVQGYAGGGVVAFQNNLDQPVRVGMPGTGIVDFAAAEENLRQANAALRGFGWVRQRNQPEAFAEAQQKFAEAQQAYDAARSREFPAVSEKDFPAFRGRTFAKPDAPAAPPAAVRAAAPAAAVATAAPAAVNPFPMTAPAIAPPFTAPAARPSAATASAPAAGTAPRVSMPSGPMAYVHKDVAVPYQTEVQKLLGDLAAMKEPTPEQRAADRARGAEAYQQAVPFRMGFLEQEIAKRGQALEGRRGSNINEALIQTGLGVMGSKSPRFMQAVGEGGTAGLNAYRQGLREIREGERDLMQSRVSFANAQSLYDQGKFTAGEREEEKGDLQRDRGIKRLQANAGILQNVQQSELQAANINQQGRAAQASTGIAAFKAALEASEQPFKNQLYAAQAKYYSDGGGRRVPTVDTTPSPQEISTAQEFARKKLWSDFLADPQKALNPNSPEFRREVDRMTVGILREGGKIYDPTFGAPPAAPTAPISRGDSRTGAQ